jgi:CheY-like chemotaxis protein/anti-sigma regulatory factor (Ser/Thr protein kinase)
MLLSGSQDATKLRRGLETIQRNARAQGLLIDDILDVARIMSGKMRLDPYPVDLTTVVQGALEAVHPSALAKGVTLEQRLERVPTTLGDPGRLQQVVWNLAMNAVKFTPKGGTIAVDLRRVDGDIQIQVEDNGRGIDAEFLPHVFDRFRQAESTARADGGLGLGLAIVHHIVELHDGRVTAESAGAGRGSTFTVRLPVRDSAQFGEDTRDTPVSEMPSPEPTFGQVLRGVKVLVVDDESDAREFVAHVLGSAGAEVVAAASSAEAFELFRQSTPDVVLSDVGMPGEDGYSLIRAIRSLPREEGGAVRAAALTAYARPHDASHAREAGFDVHIAKPIEPFELVGIVAELAHRD